MRAGRCKCVCVRESGWALGTIDCVVCAYGWVCEGERERERQGCVHRLRSHVIGKRDGPFGRDSREGESGVGVDSVSKWSFSWEVIVFGWLEKQFRRSTLKKILQFQNWKGEIVRNATICKIFKNFEKSSQFQSLLQFFERGQEFHQRDEIRRRHRGEIVNHFPAAKTELAQVSIFIIVRRANDLWSLSASVCVDCFS